MQNDVTPKTFAEDEEAQRIVDALYEHSQRKKGEYPSSIIGALCVAYSVFGELEPDDLIDEEDFDLSCKHLLSYTMVFSRDEDSDTWEQNLQKSAELALLIFGEERATAISQVVSDEYDALDERLQEELDRPPRRELN